jgi:hypothetical protein
MSESSRSTRAREWPLVLAVVAAATIVSTWPLVQSPFFIPYHQDPLFSSWRLYQWTRNLFGGGPGGAFDGNIFHPARDVLLFSDAILLPALAVAPFIRDGLRPLFAYDLLIWLSFLSAGLGMYALARDVSGSRAGALAAAAIHTGAPYRIAHVYHLELLWTCWIPLSVLAAKRAMEGQRRSGWWLGAFVAGQFFCCIYYGLFLLTVLPVIVLVAWVAAGRPAIARPVLMRATVSLAVAGVLIGLYSLPYQRARASVGDRPIDEIENYSAGLADYVVTGPANRWWGWTGARDDNDEHRLSAGLVAYALAAPALLPPIAPWTAGLLVGGAVAVEASRGLNGLLYPVLHRVAPPYKGLRVPSRMAALVLAFVAVLAAVGLARIERELGSPKWWPAVAAVLLVAVIGEQASVNAVRRLPADVPFIYRWLALQPPTVVAHFPMPRANNLPGVEQDYQYFAQYHRHRLVNGNSGYYPSMYIDLLTDVRNFPDGRSITALRARGVELIVVHRQHYREGAFAAIVEQLDLEEDVEALGAFRDELDEARVYRLRPAPGSGGR